MAALGQKEAGREEGATQTLNSWERQMLSHQSHDEARGWAGGVDAVREEGRGKTIHFWLQYLGLNWGPAVMV